MYLCIYIYIYWLIHSFLHSFVRSFVLFACFRWLLPCFCGGGGGGAARNVVVCYLPEVGRTHPRTGFVNRFAPPALARPTLVGMLWDLFRVLAFLCAVFNHLHDAPTPKTINAWLGLTWPDLQWFDLITSSPLLSLLGFAWHYLCTMRLIFRLGGAFGQPCRLLADIASHVKARGLDHHLEWLKNLPNFGSWNFQKWPNSRIPISTLGEFRCPPLGSPKLKFE